MFSKTFIATLLASTVAASPIAACTAETTTYKLLTFPTGAGSIFRGINITVDNEYLWARPDAAPGTRPAIEFSFNDGYVNIEGGQELYISDNAVKYAAPAANLQNAKGWVFIAPNSAPNTALGSLTFPGYDFYACSGGSEAGVYTIAAIPTENLTATGKCEKIQLIAQ